MLTVVILSVTYAECRYTDYRHAKCHAFIVMLSVAMLIVIMLMLSVLAPIGLYK
jgi:hypothetical protein